MSKDCVRCANKTFKGMDKEPKTKCPTCWKIYFNLNPGKLLAYTSALKAKPRNEIISKLGEKLVKMVERYQIETNKEQNG